MQPSPFTTLPLPEVAASPFPSAASRLPLPDPAAAADAIRIKGGHGKNGKPGVKTVDVGIAQGNHEHGESPAWSQGLDGRQRKAPPTMAATLGRFLQRLATTTGKLRLQARGIRASIPKAKKDMETAHVLVQTLKARAAGKTVPTPAEQVIPVDAAEDMSFIEDPEERSLRQKPHGLLAECATKMDVKENKTAEIVESSADEDKAARNAGQRPRHWTGKRAAASQPFCPHFLVNSPVSTRQSVSRNMTEL